ncbi:DNA-binding transcriptional regulator [Rhodoplanes sp. TEM]|uniref:DNA-binding transcriptional regulator n=1 Tax=Rhodoplanes tepidamans TaxID=200616 RepID=A0ABT5JJ22_RHOTP|nr:MULTISPECIES: DNA-binding transcriptional regulator [Rhodoplanes]MDC7789718.1 DNA-binding transcriptional regulator [Rhodoplanes tepidamans]MDC7985867.1 DNA-binding transcriptional regulator [Rhodoplanes sp. TEM]MDQ0354395.1 IclR family mhp operon transcriptional activator [Rhodoplanes tepidamans]
MPSFPPVQSVQRAFALLAELNKQRVATVADLHARTGLPKPTIVRLLETLIAEGYVASDKRLGGYQVTSQVTTLASGFHGAPMVIEAARPWAIDLTRRLKWPVSVALLVKDAVAVRFSTIPDSPVSPFHATINMRLSLISRGLGRAYLAWCPREERELLVRMLETSTDPEDHPPDLQAVVRQLVRTVRARGYAERDPATEPTSSSTVAIPIMADGRVLATFGLTYFRSAVPRAKLAEQVVRPLKDAGARIEEAIAAMKTR